MAIFQALLVLCVFGETLASMMQPGPCPNVELMANFDMTKPDAKLDGLTDEGTFLFNVLPGRMKVWQNVLADEAESVRDEILGTWYMHAELKVPDEFIQHKCITTEYKMGDNGTFQEIETFMDRQHGDRISRLSILRVPNPAEPAKFMKKFLGYKGEFNDQILSTDYETYALEYGCDDVKTDHAIHAYLLTREQNPTKSVIEKAEAILEKHNLPKAGFRKVKQADCDMRPDKEFDV